MSAIYQQECSKQRRVIVGVLSGRDAELAALEEIPAKARALKQGMMQGLLTGRIRLVRVQAVRRD